MVSAIAYDLRTHRLAADPATDEDNVRSPGGRRIPVWVWHRRCLTLPTRAKRAASRTSGRTI
jgi:hypothetical protein